MKHIISLGAGVQSSTMALMATMGLITPMPTLAIFADTGDEPLEVYRHLDWLTWQLCPFFPVVVASRGRLSHALLEGDEAARMPFYIGGGSIKTRQCTRDFKIRVIRRKVREWLDARPRDHVPPASVCQWIGISTDEADRQKDSGVDYMVNRCPFLESGTMMSRWQCEDWLWQHYRRIAPKSSCRQCPYRSDAAHLKLKTESPYEFAELCQFDSQLRTPENIARFHGELYVHKSRTPLIDVDLASLVASKEAQINMFTNECEGMCGV